MGIQTQGKLRSCSSEDGEGDLPTQRLPTEAPTTLLGATLGSSSTALSSIRRSTVLLLPPKLSGLSIQQEVIHLAEQAEDGYSSGDNTGAESFGREAKDVFHLLPPITGDNLITRDNDLPKAAGE